MLTQNSQLYYVRDLTFVRETIVAAGILASTRISPGGEHLEPYLAGTVPAKNRLSLGHFGHVHLVGSLMPWSLVVVYRHLTPGSNSEDVFRGSGLVAAHVNATQVGNGAIVATVLDRSSSAPFRTCNSDVGEVVFALAPSVSLDGAFVEP